MAREIYYQRQNMGGTSIGMPAMPHVQSANTGASQAYAQVAKQGFDLGEKLLGAYAEAENRKQEGLAEDAYLNAKVEMERWKENYMQTHQGVNALEAQKDFDREWNRLSENIRQSYYPQISNNDIKWKLERKMKLGQLESISNGYAYQDKQQKLWENSLDESSMAALLQGAAQHSNDPSYLDFQYKEWTRDYRSRHKGEDTYAKEQEAYIKMNKARFLSFIEQGDIEVAQNVYYHLSTGGSGGQVSTGSAGLHGAPTYTGVNRVLAYHESGKHGSLHVSYGLPQTDGVDVGKYSFITKGKGGGSVGEFIRWAGTNGGELGKKLHDEMSALVGGNWNNLDSRSLWKSEAEAKWKEIAQSDPKAFEEMEDAFMGRRFDKVIMKLDPRVQALMQNDTTGAIREMVNSTINQHEQAVSILNSNYDPNPETYIRKVYDDRGNPARFARTSDPSMGRRRMDREVNDVLGILHGGGEAQRVGAPSGLLPPAELVQMQHTLQGMRDRKEKEFNDMAKAVPDQIAFAMVHGGDFSAAQGTVEKLRAAGANDLAQEMQTNIELSRTSLTLMTPNPSKPLQETQSEGLKKIQSLITPENGRHGAQILNNAKSHAEQQVEDFKKDPAAFVMSFTVSDPNMSEQMRITKSLELQSTMGKGLIYQPRMLPKEVAEGMRANFDKIKDGMEMADFLLGLQKTYGPYTEGVLSEMKIPSGVAVVLPALGSMPRKDLGVFVMGMTARGSDIPKVEADELDAMKQAIGSEFELLNITREFAREFPNNKDIQSFFNSITRGGFNYLKLTGKDNFDNIDNAFSMSGDKKCFILLPNYLGVKAGDVTSALSFFRESGMLREDFEKRGFAKDYAQGKTHRIAASNLEQMYNDGIFVSTADGKHAVLIDPSTEQPFKKKNGEMYMVDFDTVLKKYKGYSE